MIGRFARRGGTDEGVEKSSLSALPWNLTRKLSLPTRCHLTGFEAGRG